MTEAPTTNRFAGSCGRCGAKVPAETGLYDRSQGVQHATEAECKKTTKTWRKFEQGRKHAQARADMDAAWTAAGFDRRPESWPATAGGAWSSHGSASIDGARVRTIQGGAPNWTQTDIGHETVRVFQGVGSASMEIGRFDLDRPAINAAATDPDPYRQSVQRNQAEIDQILAGIRELLS